MVVTAHTSASTLVFSIFLKKGKQLYQKNFKQDKRGTVDNKVSFPHLTFHSSPVLCRENKYGQFVF